MGARAVDKLGLLAEGAEVVFTILQTGAQVACVCQGIDGVFAHLDKEVLYIDSSSIDVTTSQALHGEAQQRGIAMLDASVSGGVAGAEQASLMIIVEGGIKPF